MLSKCFQQEENVTIANPSPQNHKRPN